MICTKCKNDGVQNEVLGKTFYYCRSCKIEIMPESAKKDAGSGHAHAWSGVLDACVRCGMTSTEYMAYPTACYGQPNKAVPVGGLPYPPAPTGNATSPNPLPYWGRPFGAGTGGVGGGQINAPVNRPVWRSHYYALPNNWKANVKDLEHFINDFLNIQGRTPTMIRLHDTWRADIAFDCMRLGVYPAHPVGSVSSAPTTFTILGVPIAFGATCSTDRVEIIS